MQKAININDNWEIGIYWRDDWKFIGAIQYAGFGRYVGITFKKFKWKE